MNKILVLLYHGVSDEKEAKGLDLRNYNFKHLSKTTFEKQIQDLSKNCNIISIDELVEYWQGKYIFNKPTVVITFDDGFKNNFYIAKPILEKYEVPATFYISTGNVTNQEIFWVDILEIIFSKTKIIEINKENMPNIFNLIYPEDKMICINNRFNKIKILNKIKKKLKLFHPLLRQQKITKISSELKVEISFKPDEYNKDYSILNWEELKIMNSSSLFTIGGHSRWHNILSKLTGKELEDEINGSIKDIKSNLGALCEHYAYPEGQKEHFNSETIKVLKKFGIKACPSAIQGFAEKRSQSLFNFKRVMIGIDQTSDQYIKEYIN